MSPVSTKQGESIIELRMRYQYRIGWEVIEWTLFEISCRVCNRSLCVVAQILIDKTKLTSARILVLYVVTGVFLTAIGVYGKLVKIGRTGATIPLTGFGYALCKGVFKAMTKRGS